MKKGFGSPTVHFISLGCPKNRVDTERTAAVFLRRGYRSVASPEDADVILVNTCAFIEPATQESLDTILEMAEYRKERSCSRLIVTGCLVSRYGAELEKNLPEVDCFLGTDAWTHVARELYEPAEAAGSEARPGPVDCGRLLSTPWYSAYLKIAEGCDHHCTYCVIPRIRGPFRSAPPELLLKEARYLAQQGVMELNVVGQDTTRYGSDLPDSFDLPRLLGELAAIPEFRWIRTLYLYPEGVTDRLLQTVSRHKSLLPYFDLPIQHVSRSILKRMGRWNPARRIEDLVARIRSVIPEAVLRMTVMVGFPGETEDDFRQLAEFIQWAQPEHLGAFRFYAEEGAPASSFSDAVPEEIQEDRVAWIMEIQSGLSRARNERRVGSEITVLVEGPDEEDSSLVQGRAWWHAPEVDGMVLCCGSAEPGQWVRVRVTEALEYDLVGRVVGGDTR